MKREHASRTAVRMALNLLRAEGLIQRLQGIGTVAIDNGQVRVPLDPPRSVARLCGDEADRVGYVRLSLLATTVSSSVAAKLDIPCYERVVFLERLTMVEDRPLSVASVWIPMSLGEAVLSGGVDLQRRGIFDILEQGLGLELGISEYSLEATIADEAVAGLIDVSPGSPVVLLGTLTRLADGRPAALGYTRGRGDRLRYEFLGHRHPDASNGPRRAPVTEEPDGASRSRVLV